MVREARRVPVFEVGQRSLLGGQDRPRNHSAAPIANGSNSGCLANVAIETRREGRCSQKAGALPFASRAVGAAPHGQV
jgi:hypothetical protein